MKKAIIILLVLVALTAGASAQSFGNNGLSQQMYGQWVNYQMNISYVQVGPMGFDQFSGRYFIPVQQVRMERYNGMRSGYVMHMGMWMQQTAHDWWYRYIPYGPVIRQYI